MPDFCPELRIKQHPSEEDLLFCKQGEDGRPVEVCPMKDFLTLGLTIDECVEFAEQLFNHVEMLSKTSPWIDIMVFQVIRMYVSASLATRDEENTDCIIQSHHEITVTINGVRDIQEEKKLYLRYFYNADTVPVSIRSYIQNSFTLL
jgi:hypothetical protein